jgi:hypothetical protein
MRDAELRWIQESQTNVRGFSPLKICKILIMVADLKPKQKFNAIISQLFRENVPGTDLTVLKKLFLAP